MSQRHSIAVRSASTPYFSKSEKIYIYFFKKNIYRRRLCHTQLHVPRPPRRQRLQVLAAMRRLMAWQPQESLQGLTATSRARPPFFFRVPLQNNPIHHLLRRPRNLHQPPCLRKMPPACMCACACVQSAGGERQVSLNESPMKTKRVTYRSSASPISHTNRVEMKRDGQSFV